MTAYAIGGVSAFVTFVTVLFGEGIMKRNGQRPDDPIFEKTFFAWAMPMMVVAVVEALS